MTLTEDLEIVQRVLTRYILVTCLILGIVGSLLNLCIFCQKKLRFNPCSIYFIGTSIFNLLVILCGIMPIILTSYQSTSPFIKSSIFCKIRAYITHIFLMMSRSSVALACIDRYALCSRKVCIRQLSNSRIAIVSIFIISILWLILPIHVLIYTDIQMPGERCGASGTYLIIYSIYAAIVTSIPLIIMIIFSFLAVENLRDSRARTHPVPSNTSIPIRKRDIQLMTMLISDVTVYFLSTVWFPIYTIYLAITIDVSKTADRLAVEGFIRYLTLNFLIFINSCSIFYIHLFTSKAFYHECKQLILRLFKINQNNRVCQGVILTPNLQHRLNDRYNQRQTVANSTIT